MTRLSLAFLGPLQVHLEGQPVRAAGYDKVWALLAYLALSPSVAYSRDSLTALLWPEQTEAAARTNLRQALARLRQAIGDQAAQPPFLLIDHETLQFNPASDYQLDVTEFMALAAAADTHRHRHRETCRPCAQRNERAMALYRGRFLEQFFLPDSAAFEEWALVTRELLHQQALAGLSQLADYHERRGAYEPARQYAARLLALDPWREEAHRQLMRLLVVSGRRSEALVQYERCRSVLAAELRIEPAAETTAYYQSIRASEFAQRGLADFPAGPAADSHHAGLPAPPTPFVGRERELAALGNLLANPACRLITLVGPGGIGKTRLAIQAASEQSAAFTQGVVFVPLAPLSSASLIVPAIAGALGLSLSGQEAPPAQLLRYLRDQELLLVLDNIEHLSDGAALLLAILREAPQVTLLVTSRERLKMQAEWVFDVDGLPAPAADYLGPIDGFDAVALFVQRARQAFARFELDGAEAPAVARLCRRLAGMPLGIELAAAGVRARSCLEIVRAIEQDLDVLTSELRDVPDRHKSLRAVFNHSWNLLAAGEQDILCRLTVFRGGFTSEAAGPVAGAAPVQLQALVDKSLLRHGAGERYELHEVVRQYAAERLRAAEAEADTSARHLAYFSVLAERQQPERLRLGARLSFQRLAAENDNFRAALEWCRRRDRITAWLRLAAALWFHWEASGTMTEGLFWVEAALERASAAPEETEAEATSALDPGFGLARSVRARALISAAAMRRRCGDYAQAEAHAQLALALCLNQWDEGGIASAQHILGRVLRDQGDYRQSKPLLEDSLAHYRAVGDWEGVALVLGSLAIHHRQQGMLAQAQALAEESAALCRQQGDFWHGAFQMETLGGIAFDQRNFAQAQAHLEQALELFQAVGFKPGQANSLDALGRVSQARCDLAAARTHYEACLALRRLMGNSQSTVNVLTELEQLALAQGDAAAARLFAGERERLAATGGPSADTSWIGHR